MHRTRYALLLSAGLVFSTWAVDTRAQPAPAPSGDVQTDKARELHIEADALYRRGDYAKARASYLAAWALKQHWQIAGSLADCEKPGGSSIALLAEGEAEVMLTRCTVAAGNGADGPDGAPFDMPATGGSEGLIGADACTGAMLFGGASVKNNCGAEGSISGSGGIGQEFNGGSGSPGSPLGSMNGGLG
jgi:hypothetical protein